MRLSRLLILVIISCPASAARADVVPVSELSAGLELGQKVFLTYCAGCHGFNGLAFYPPAPSFAMGDRLAKSDVELMNSILRGKGVMPSWESKLPRFWLEQALAYLRHMERTGNFDTPKNWDGPYYIFSPPGTDPTVDWRDP
jgi:mono/diheme cytochrome c family protein